MNAALTPQDRLLNQLLDLSRNPGDTPCLCLRAAHSHCVKAYQAPGPLLALPLQGRKRALENGRWVDVVPGEIFLVPGPRSIDVENIPDPASGEYVAVGVALDETVLEAARLLVRTPVQAEPQPLAAVPLAALAEPLLEWATALQQGRYPQACHALVGAVLRLHELGYSSLLTRPQPSLAQRVRTMVADNPARDWNSGDFEHAFGMSGATLRRHLAAEGTTLREVMANARLAQALQLLYSTRLPVKAVAQRVGYASPSSFSKRFAERYGMEPSAIGNA